MSTTVTIFHNALDPQDRTIARDVDDTCLFLKQHLGHWPSTARIYHNAVAQSNDVTPHCEADIKRLQYMDGNIFIVIWPEDPITIAIIAGIVIAAVVIGLVFLLHKPTPETGQGSPNNQLTDRQNTARPNERIPDIYGTVRSTPDLIALPYKAFVNNQEFEYIYGCIGRQYFTVLDCLDDQTPVDWIDCEWAGVYPPFSSPNSVTPVIQNSFGTPPAVIPPIVTIQRSNAVNGQQIRGSNAGNFYADNNVAFQFGGTILGNGSGIDFTQYFTAGTMLVPEYMTIQTNDDGVNASDPAGIESSVGLAGTYEILDVTATTITLSNAATVNANWSALAAFAGTTSTYYHSFLMFQVGVPVLGPIILDMVEMTEVWANFVAPAGLYLINNKGTQVALTWTIEMDVQAVNSALEPVGDIISGSINVVGQALEQSLVGSTLKLVLPSPGPCQVTVKSLTALGIDKRNSWVQTVQWRDLYAVSALTFALPYPRPPEPGEFVQWAFADTVVLTQGSIPPATTVAFSNEIVAARRDGSFATIVGGGGVTTGVGNPFSGTGQVVISNFATLNPIPSDAYITSAIGTAIPGGNGGAQFGFVLDPPTSIVAPGSSIATLNATLAAATWSIFCAQTIPGAMPLTCTVGGLAIAVYYKTPPGGGGFSEIGFPVASGDFGDVTTVYGITAQTADALSIRERKLNLLVTRNLPTWINRGASGPPQFSTKLSPTNNAADIFAAMTLDPIIGRRLLSELNVPEIYAVADSSYLSNNNAVIDGLLNPIFDGLGDQIFIGTGEHVDGEIATYFGTFLMTEFCYTFDDSKVSFEEMASYLAQAINSIAYRTASTISLSFEKATDDSTLLFNHRNKLPNSEQRTFSFGVINDNDGITYDFIDPNSPNYPDQDTTHTLYIPTDGSAQNPRKVTSIGVRNIVQATINSWRMYQKLVFANGQTTFNATQEAKMSLRNDRILVADNTRSETQDGELIDVSGLEVTTSQPVVFDGGVTYTGYFQHYDNTVEAIPVTAGSEPNKVVLATAPLLPFVTDLNKFARTTYQIVGNTGAPATAFLVQDKTPNDDSTFALSAINYSDDYYTHDTDFTDSAILAPAAGYGPQGYTGSGLLAPNGAPYVPPARGPFDSSTYAGSPLQDQNNPDGPPVTDPPTTPGDVLLILVNGS